VLDPEAMALARADGNQTIVALASTPDACLALWNDQRSGISQDIYATRLSTAGTLLDSGFAVSTSGNEQSRPALTFAGADYLAVWQDLHDSLAYDVRAIRVSSSGAVVDSAPFTISAEPGSQMNPALAFAGMNSLVAWQDSRNGWLDIYCARVSPDGTVLDPEGISISGSTYLQYEPVVATDSNDYLVVWSEYINSQQRNDIYSARVTSAGVVLDSLLGISVLPEQQAAPAVAFDGENYLVAWHDYRSVTTADIYGTRVTKTGVVLDPSGFAISTATNSQMNPALAFDGVNYFVIWEDGRNSGHDLYAARVTPDARVLDAAGVAIARGSDWLRNASLAFDGERYVAAWEYGQVNGPWGVRGAWIDSSGAVIDTFSLPRGRADEITPALASGPNERFLLLCSSFTDSISRRPVEAMRILGCCSGTSATEESRPARTRPRGATIARGVLRVGSPPTADGSRLEAGLYDANGRRVMNLVPGQNDIRHLAPGVYFVGSQEAGVGVQGSGTVRKVVVQN